MFDGVSYLDEIKNATFEIETGKITGIAGSSKSFKSTLIDLMSGMISTNEIYYDFDFKDIGVMYQDINDQFFFDNIKDEFIFTLKRHHVKDFNKKMMNALKIVDFDDDYLYRSPFELSLSEQKRLSLALILSYNPKIILFDEPVFGLDNKEKERFIKLIRMMKIRYGKTIVIASKDTEFIHKLADNVILVSNGEVIKTGNKYDIFSDELLLERCNLPTPKVIKVSNLIYNKKNIKIGYRDDINDLVKDMYRYLRWF